MIQNWLFASGLLESKTLRVAPVCTRSHSRFQVSTNSTSRAGLAIDSPLPLQSPENVVIIATVLTYVADLVLTTHTAWMAISATRVPLIAHITHISLTRP